MANEAYVMLAGVFGGFIGGLFGLIVAGYNAKSARRNKLMELEFDMYWSLIRRSQELMDRFDPENLGPTQASDLSDAELATRSLVRDLVLLAGHPAAAKSFQSFEHALATFVDVLTDGPKIVDRRVPMPIANAWIEASTRLTEFHIEVRKVLKGID